MSLPQQLKTARTNDSEFGNTLDDTIGAAEQAVADILGVPVNTNITAALFEVVAGGLNKIILQNAGANPAATGVLLRNATLLKYHDGSAVQTLARLADIAAPSNAAGVRTISTSAPSGTPADGDTWERY